MWSCIMNNLQGIDNNWSVGSFGAIAEFSLRPNDRLNVLDAGNFGGFTAHGGIGWQRIEHLQPVAYETLNKNESTWGQAVSFYLPAKYGQRAGRTFITELGADKGSLQHEHHDHILFDLGLGVNYTDFCVRTNNKEQIRQLRAAFGSRLLNSDNTVLPVLTLHPANPCLDTDGNHQPFDMNKYEMFQKLLQRWGIDEYRQQKTVILNALDMAKNVSVDSNSGESRLMRMATRIAIRQHAHLKVRKDIRC